MTDSPDLQPTEAITRRSARGSKTKPQTTDQSLDGASTRDAAAKTGIGALLAKHPTAWLASALAVVFLLLGTGAVFAGIANGSQPVVAVSTPSPTPTVEPPRPVPAAIPAASRLRTCSVQPQATDPRLATLYGHVINANTGEVLFDRAGTTPGPTASVMKVLIGAAALAVLGPDGRFSTRVMDAGPGKIALVGGGDPTLSIGNSFYTGAPSIYELANQARAAYDALYDEPITEIILDATMWDPSDGWDPSWPAEERWLGYQPIITALMVDGDRENPSRGTSPRSEDPIGRAGNIFAGALGVGDVTFTRAAAPTSTLLAEVQSQPVSVLIGDMIPYSDNTMGEMLARLISVKSGGNGSAASLSTVIPAALANYGLDTTGVWIQDGSGESNLNAVSPAFVSQLMIKVLKGEGSLAVVRDVLPVAGKSGTLSSRFTGDNAVARGSVFAKTGWIEEEHALGGFMNAADGSQLTFAFYAIAGGTISDSAKEALDTLTTAVWRCGDNLSNN